MIHSIFEDLLSVLRHAGLALFRFLIDNDGTPMRYRLEAHDTRGPGAEMAREAHSRSIERIVSRALS
jgi:hypothetical protein